MTKKKALEVSFEFFPAKTRSMSIALWKAIQKLEKLNPEFVSVTYGAGGSTRDKTQQILKKSLITPSYQQLLI